MRSRLSSATNEKILFSHELMKKLKFVPGLRLVALTGSVAANNSHPKDDIDLFFITAPHTLWLVRPLVLLVISIFYRRRHPGEDHAKAANAFCPNLWLDSLSVTVPVSKQNLYTAHEVLQIIPLIDRGGTYQKFLYENRWTKKYLANAYKILTSQSSLSKGEAPQQAGRGIPPSSVILAPFNYLSYIIQVLYMYPKKTTETVHLHAAYLHTTDFASQISHHLKSFKDL